MTQSTVADARAVIDEIGRAALRQQESARQLRRAMDELSITAGNQDGSVKVSIDANGGLTDLEISRTAMRLGHDGLREEILRGMKVARQHLSERVGNLATDAFGKDSVTASKLRETYVDAFGGREVGPRRGASR